MNAGRELAEASRIAAHYGPRALRGATVEIGHLIGLASIIVIVVCAAALLAVPA